MGEKIPEELPISPWPPFLDPYLLYCITVNAYQEPGKSGCNGAFETVRCCQYGSIINDFETYGLWCINGIEICTYTGYSAQELVNVIGPYLTEEECWIACGL